MSDYKSFHEEIEAKIAETGVMMIGFPGPGGRPIVYTIGLTDMGWKELVFVGLRADYAQGIINAIVQSGQQPIQGVQITGGQFWGEHGLSNFWYWREVLPDGSLSKHEESGYGW